MRRTIAAATALVLALGLAACSADSSSLSGDMATQPLAEVPGPAPAQGASKAPACNPRASLAPLNPMPQAGKMPAGSYMETIQKRGRLILGTSQDTLLFSSRNPFTGEIEGFDVDMGRQVAAALFGDPNKIQIKVIGYDQRVSSVVSGAVDIVADTMTANCERKQDVNFSSIYYEAGQKVLVSTSSGATRIEDLGGKKVCSVQGSTSFDNIAKVKAKTKPIAVARAAFGDCLVAFQRNEVDAVTTDDTILAGMAAQDPYAKVVGQKFTEEPYGMAMPKQHPEFTQFVNGVLARNRANGTWQKTYDKWLGATFPVAASR
ncbi:glutamate ABC transporter substrate-binding protein [Actinoplanes sp. NPDC000266]